MQQRPPPTLLKSLLRNRLGRFVPTDGPHPSLCAPWHYESPSASASTVSSDDLATHEQVKQFMRQNFYREGPIPRALQLADGSPRVSAFIDKEMSMYMGSGTSVVVRDKSSSISGVAFTALWRRDDDYEVIGADVTSWHNVAAEIALEVDKEESRLVWRDYQFQHLYDLCQKSMRENGQELAMWIGMLSFSTSLRGSGMLDVLISQARERIAKCGGGVVGTQSNFRAFDKQVWKICKDPVMVDEVMYGDETLIFRGKRVFKTLQHLGAARFYVGIS